MSNDRIIKEAGWIKNWISKIKDRKIQKELPGLIAKDPAMQKQAKKVIKAFDDWEDALDDAEAFAKYLINKNK